MAFGLTRDGVLNSISRRWPQELRRQYDLYQKDRPVPAQRTACSIDVANYGYTSLFSGPINAKYASAIGL